MVDLPSTLGLMWLASPALPVGGFSYSEGLEAAVEAGMVRDEASAAQWLASQLGLAQARSELPLVAAAWRGWGLEEGRPGVVEALNRWVLATRETSELRLQAEQMGRSLAEWLRHQPPGDADQRLRELRSLRPAPTWPVAFALAAWRTGAALEPVLAACAFGWAENAVQAAIKAVPMGQAAGQRILGRLAQEIPAVVERALAVDAAHAATGSDSPPVPLPTPEHGRQAFSPMLVILSARHETQ
jgi:urease accessory protein